VSIINAVRIPSVLPGRTGVGAGAIDREAVHLANPGKDNRYARAIGIRLGNLLPLKLGIVDLRGLGRWLPRLTEGSSRTRWARQRGTFSRRFFLFWLLDRWTDREPCRVPGSSAVVDNFCVTSP
jgi:hypothetical protein